MSGVESLSVVLRDELRLKLSDDTRGVVAL
jgi:hypothetical protein